MGVLSEKTKKDFPSLSSGAFVYLDTAATSQTPQTVIDAMVKYYTEYRANIHRGLYSSAEMASAHYDKARSSVANLISAKEDEIIFTAGATLSSNMLIYALEQTLDLHEGDEIVTSVMEHHSSLVPLQELAKRKGLVIRYIPLGNSSELDYATAEKYITNKTKIVSVMLASNVLGTINDVARVAKASHDVGAIMISDATAAVGHITVNVKDLGVDFLYFSGHKMCGPTGVGILYGKKEKLDSLTPSFFGGGMVDVISKDKEAVWTNDVSRFEAGTPPIAEAIWLGEAIAYLQGVGIDEARFEVEELLAYAVEKMSLIPGVNLFCERDPKKNAGIISFTVDGIHAHDIAQITADNNVAIRAGHHCAMPLMKVLGVQATARMSVWFYNTKEDIDALCAVIEKAKKIFDV